MPARDDRVLVQVNDITRSDRLDAGKRTGTFIPHPPGGADGAGLFKNLKRLGDAG